MANRRLSAKNASIKPNLYDRFLDEIYEGRIDGYRSFQSPSQEEDADLALEDRIAYFQDDPQYINIGSSGSALELIACAWLLKTGYQVFRNVAPQGPIDIVATKGGSVLKIDVKKASYRTGCFCIASGQIRKIKQLMSDVRNKGVRYLIAHESGDCEWFEDAVSRWERYAKRSNSPKRVESGRRVDPDFISPIR